MTENKKKTHGIWELCQASHINSETLWAGARSKLVQEGHPLLSTIALHQARHVSQSHLRTRVRRNPTLSSSTALLSQNGWYSCRIHNRLFQTRQYQHCTDVAYLLEVLYSKHPTPSIYSKQSKMAKLTSTKKLNELHSVGHGNVHAKVPPAAMQDQRVRQRLPHLAVLTPVFHQRMVVRRKHCQALGTLHQVVNDSMSDSCTIECRRTPPWSWSWSKTSTRKIKTG